MVFCTKTKEKFLKTIFSETIISVYLKVIEYQETWHISMHFIFKSFRRMVMYSEDSLYLK